MPLLHRSRHLRRPPGSYCLFLLLASGWLLAAMIRLVFRDISGIQQVDLLYYATPGPMLFVAALGISLLAVLSGHRRGAACWVMLAVILPHCAGSQPPRLAEASSSPEATTAASTAPRSHRLVYWNVSHLDHRVSLLAGEILRYQPDIITLVEAGPATEDLRAVWKKYFPEYELTLLGGEILLLTKGVAGNVRAYDLPHDSRLREVELTLDEERLTVMIVDIQGRPSLSREPSLTRVAEIVRNKGNGPLLIAGDFNTPRDSLLLQPLQRQLVNAFDVAGTGYAPTWPVPLPVLTIDQVWGNHLTFHSCVPGWSNLSDHRPLIVDFSIAR